ncbi:MAG TPA: hypothetical protein VGD95_06190 [Micavibrio sp.]
MSNFVTATFKTRMAAEDALRRLEAIGISDKQISMITTDSTRGAHFNLEQHSQVDQGVAGGATAGGLIGAALGALAVAGTIVVPGLNLIVTGAYVGALAGLATGAVAGGLVGGLIGAGIPEYEAKIYEREIRNGAILIAVDARDSAQKDQIKKCLEMSDAHNLAA